MLMQEDKHFRRIRRDKAKKLFEEGKDVYALPCQLRLDNAWIKPSVANKEGFENFEKFENSYIYYNCRHETGRYVAWYERKFCSSDF